MKRCTKGKSCGATCITRSDRCVLELGPLVSESLTKVRSKLGVVKLYAHVKEQKIKGFQQKFNNIRGQLKKDIGGQVHKTADVLELKKRLQEAGLLPKSKKSEDLGEIFKGLVEKGKEDRAPSLPSDLKRQLAALGGEEKKPTGPITRYNRRVAEAEEAAKRGEKTAPVEGRKLERSPQEETKTPQKVLKKGDTDLLFDDISRLMRGETPRNIEVASAPGFEGFKARFLGTPTPLGATTGNTRWAREDAQDFDGALGKVRREGEKGYKGWEDSYKSGARKIGEGSYGTVIRNPDGTFVKRGDISDTEAALIKRLGDVDLGPKLRAADINGPAQYHKENFVNVRNGRIAMGEVPGKPIGGNAQADTKFGGKNAADVYWKAMADLHRMGIAHNDAHIDNILIDKNGKGRWVDLGLAQANPKAALAEAMGVFNPLKGAEATRVQGAYGQGNWQTRRWDGTGVRAAEKAREAGGQKWLEFMERFPVASRVWENRPAAQYKLLDMGLSKNDVSSIIDHGIRSTPESYTKGAWAKLTDKQAQEVLNILYDGI